MFLQMRMKINIVVLLSMLMSCSMPKVEQEPCHTIQHEDIDLTIKSMEDYAAMNWDDHRSSYTEDGTVSINSLKEEDILGIDESIVTYKAQRENGPWLKFFWTGINADRVILDYPGFDPEAWVFVWCDWNGILAETGDTISAAVHIANRMSPDGLIRYHYVNMDKAPIVTALAK